MCKVTVISMCNLWFSHFKACLGQVLDQWYRLQSDPAQCCWFLPLSPCADAAGSVQSTHSLTMLLHGLLHLPPPTLWPVIPANAPSICTSSSRPSASMCWSYHVLLPEPIWCSEELDYISLSDHGSKKWSKDQLVFFCPYLFIGRSIDIFLYIISHAYKETQREIEREREGAKYFTAYKYTVGYLLLWCD